MSEPLPTRNLRHRPCPGDIWVGAQCDWRVRILRVTDKYVDYESLDEKSVWRDTREAFRWRWNRLSKGSGRR